MFLSVSEAALQGHYMAGVAGGWGGGCCEAFDCCHSDCDEWSNSWLVQISPAAAAGQKIVFSLLGVKSKCHTFIASRILCPFLHAHRLRTETPSLWFQLHAFLCKIVFCNIKDVMLK